MRENHLDIISTCSAILGQSADSGRILMQLCRALAEACHSRIAMICHLEPNSQRVHLDGSYGLFVEEIQPNRQADDFIRNVLQRRRTFNTPIRNGVTIDGVPLRKSIADRCGSLLAQPLLVGGRMVGVLLLARKARQAYPKSVAEVVSLLSPAVAAYLANTIGHDNGDERSPGVISGDGHSQEIFRKGQPIVPGVAYGRCQLLAGDDALRNAVIHRCDDCAGQLELLERTYQCAREALKNASSVVSDFIAEADDGIFEMYAALMDDPTLRERIEAHIASGVTVDSALAMTYRDFAQEFLQIDDAYLRERLLDVEDIILRLLNASRNLEVPSSPEAFSSASPAATDQPIILVASELFTSQLISAPLRHVSGIVCQSGGATSHATILARALRIPMLSSLPGIHRQLTPQDYVLLDCQSGICFQNPAPSLLQQYRVPLENTRRIRESRDEGGEVQLDDLPATTDGAEVRLSGNITLFSELPALRAAGIPSVGLYRTEFMFMIRNNVPDEDTQHRVFHRLVSGCGDAPVALRVVDIGGDKPLPYIKWGEEANPSLGWRGLRFLLSDENREFTLTHFRAILRAAAESPNLSLMLPMVADLHDLRQAKALLGQAARSLASAGVACRMPKIGIMVELPSAALALEQLLAECDYISIGTNDLVQYLFGVDRGNSRVSQWYRQCHPVVFRMLGRICDTVAQFPGKEAAICGELAGNLRAVPAVLGAGLRHLSMNPANIPAVRDYIRRVSLEECRSLYQNACSCSSAQEVHALLDGFWKQHMS